MTNAADIPRSVRLHFRVKPQPRRDDVETMTAGIAVSMISDSDTLSVQRKCHPGQPELLAS